MAKLYALTICLGMCSLSKHSDRQTTMDLKSFLMNVFFISGGNFKVIHHGIKLVGLAPSSPSPKAPKNQWNSQLKKHKIFAHRYDDFRKIWKWNYNLKRRNLHREKINFSVASVPTDVFFKELAILVNLNCRQRMYQIFFYDLGWCCLNGKTFQNCVIKRINNVFF